MLRVTCSRIAQAAGYSAKGVIDYSTRKVEKRRSLRIWPSSLLPYLGHFAGHHYMPLFVALFAKSVDGVLFFLVQASRASRTPTRSS